MKYRLLPVIHELARLNIIFACIFWLPGLISMYEGDRLEAVWLIFFAIIALFSTLIYQMTKHCQRALQGRDGFLFASLFSFKVDEAL